jgi:hypothetical protein
MMWRLSDRVKEKKVLAVLEVLEVLEVRYA